jgi:serine-type D-Ala-D-Ala carboxypeptidase/endopeptidase
MSAPSNYQAILERSLKTFMPDRGAEGTTPVLNTVGGILGVYAGGAVGYLPFGLQSLGGAAVTQATRFELASVTKTFTAALLGEQPALFSAAVSQSLNNISSNYSLTAMGQQIIFEELATFSGGFPDDTQNNPVNPPTQDNFVAYVNALSPPQLPAAYAYSNDSFGFLGQVLMGLQGYDIKQFGQGTPMLDDWYSANITGPQKLQMSSTSTSAAGSEMATGYSYGNGVYTPHPPFPWAPWGAAGALRSSAEDMMIYVQAYLGVTQIGGISVPPALTAGMQVAIQPTSFSAPDGNKMGFGWVVTPKGIVFKDGAHVGFSSWVGLVPASQIGLVILVNTGGNPVGDVGLYILNAMLNGS